MSAASLTPSQQDLVKEAALASGFKEFDVAAEVGTIKGDNYLGVIHSVRIHDKNSDKIVYLILKSAHTNEVFRKSFPLVQMFKREAYLYGFIFPALLKLQDEKVISHPFTGVAKYYGSRLEERNESILMENLKEHGYKLWDRMQPMDDAHVSAVFAEYARLHAASFALKHHRPEEFQELTKNITKTVFDDGEEAKEKMGQMVGLYFTNGLKAVRDSPKGKAALEKMLSNFQDLFQSLESEGTDTFVVTHGDCWCNNMLFKYEDNQTQPSKVCFIDWQLSKLAPPTVDLAYFFSSCGSKEVFPNIDKYLDIYHQELSQNLRESGCDPDEVFSLEKLKSEWKRTAWFGVFISMMIVKLMLSESDEVPDVGNIEKESDNMISRITDFKMTKSTQYETRICDLVEFMVDNNYLE